MRVCKSDDNLNRFILERLDYVSIEGELELLVYNEGAYDDVEIYAMKLGLRVIFVKEFSDGCVMLFDVPKGRVVSKTSKLVDYLDSKGYNHSLTFKRKDSTNIKFGTGSMKLKDYRYYRRVNLECK